LIGTNAPEGVILNYYLEQKADTNEVKLEIIGANGKASQIIF
jgi:hypothetical protein